MVGALSSSNPEDDGHLWRGDLESGKGRACDTAAHSAIETAERNVSRLPGERVQHIKHKSTALSEENKEREREREREIVSIMVMMRNRSATDVAQMFIQYEKGDARIL